MDAKEIREIYDRLGDISLKADPQLIPNPQEISRKIGQGHIFLEEVEKYYIKVNKEMTEVGRNLLTMTTAYEIQFDELIANDDDIIILPSSRDRGS